MVVATRYSPSTPRAQSLYRAGQIPASWPRSSLRIRSRKSDLGKFVLLISDRDMRVIIQDVLASQGYLVEAAGDIGVAVDRLKESTLDLLIIRPYISTMPGHEAAEYLRTKCPGLPVLMVGGLIDDTRLSYRDALQNIHIFPKPFTAERRVGDGQKA